jgi:ATP phosphoribosyltransferase
MMREQGLGVVRLGLPKGRLLGTSERVLHALGVERAPSSPYRIVAGDVVVWLLKMRDIPGLVARGELDMGIAPDEWIAECEGECDRLARLDGYSTRISMLVPQGRPLRLDALDELRVATEFPNVTRRHLAGVVRKLRVIEVHGSCEAYPRELADGVVDCVESGDTARLHGLTEHQRLLNCGLHLIAHARARESTRHRDVARQIVHATGGTHLPTPTHTNGAGPAFTSVRLHELPPYLRAALLPVIRHEGVLQLGADTSLRLARPRASAAYLALWDRELLVAAEGFRSPQELAASLEDHLAAGALREGAVDLFYLVALLSIWDDVIRELRLYGGRVYMASEEATRRLFGLAGLDPPSPEDFATLLLEAQALELMYRFPVAFKFRGAYGAENQCRLNGWGRRLARRAFRDPQSATLHERLRDALRRHVIEYRDAYASHIDYVSSQGLVSAPGDSWSVAKGLPVPILL